MKVFIVSSSIFILSFMSLMFLSDFNAVELAEGKLKQDANNIAAGVISFYDLDAYSEGILIIDDAAAIDYITDYQANSSQFGFSDYTVYIFDDSLTYRVYNKDTITAVPIPFSYSSPLHPNYVKIDNEDIEITEPTVLVKLTSTGDFYRFDFLNKDSITRASKYIADNRNLYKEFEEEPEGDIEEGLLGHYIFSNNLEDQSGNERHGTAIGSISYGEGITGFGVEFDGSTSIVDMGDTFDMRLSDFTFSTWVKTPQMTSEDPAAYIMSKSTETGQEYRYGVGVQGGANRGKPFVLVSWNSEEPITYMGNRKIDDGKWHHLLCSFDRDNNLTVYVDGKIDSVHDISSKKDVDMNSNNPFRLGAYTIANNVGGSRFFNGSLDSVRIYNRTLSFYEVAMLYNEQYPQLLAWYPLNGSAMDSSGNELDGFVFGPTSIVGLSGLAYSFDGVDDYIIIPTLTFEINQTATALIDFSQVTSEQCFLGGTSDYGVRYDGSHFSVYTGSGSYTKIPWARKNTPVLFGITRTGLREYEIYIDNKLIGTVDTASDQDMAFSFLGRSSSGLYFKGSMQNVRFYNKALDLKDIQQQYDELLNFEKDGLILHYTFENFAVPTTNEYNYPTFNTSAISGGWSHWGSAGHAGSYGQNTNSSFIYGDQSYSHWVANGAEATKPYLLYKSPAFEGGYRSLQAVICMDDKSPVTNDKVYPTWNARNGGIPNSKWTSIKRIGNTHFYLCKAEGIIQDGSNDLVGIYVNPGYKIYVSQMQLEQKDHCTAFVDGTRLGTVVDKSGNENNTALTDLHSPMWEGDTNTGAGHYRFNGVNQSIRLPVVPPTEFTISFWFYKDSWSAKPWETLLGGPSNDFAIHSKSNATNAPRLLLPGRSVNQAIYEMDKWNHVIFVRTTDGSKLYLNGKLVISGTAGSIPTGDYFIGCSIDDVTQNFKGLIDDFRIYNRALSSGEIALLGETSRK